MKIDATSSVYGIDPYRNIQNKRAVQPAAALLGSDEAEFSSDAVSFAEAFSAVKIQMEEHLSGTNPYIEVAKAQIASGTYVVDHEDLASSILLFT